ncbi:MAG: AMP-binding protein [Calditrichia bacterium]|nr:AMP-binding protein [Calditrichia bacterium]
MFLKPHNNTAISYKKEKISYKQLIDQAIGFSLLYESETTKRVAIFSENRPEWIYTFYSAWKNGATVVPIDFMSTPDEIAYILNDCQPEVIFCSKETKATLKKALEQVTHNTKLFVFEEIKPVDSITNDKTFSTPDLNETAVIIYTSGTTGSPKGVMLSYENLLANIDAVSQEVKVYAAAERVMILLPLHHIFPLLGSMAAPLYVGGTVAISPSITSEDIMATLQDNKISIIIGVPRFYNLIYKGVMDKINANPIAKALYKVADLAHSKALSKALFKTVHQKFGGSLKYLVCGGAAIDKKVARGYQILGFEMLEGFGMTEAAPMITFTRPGKVMVGSAGQAMPCTKIEIRNGEIVASGKNIMQGYYNRPEETAEVLKDGWLYTGDLGYLDKKGFIHITGRKKEIVVLPNGKNVNPAEVEIHIERLGDFIKEIGVFMKDDILQAVIYPDEKKLEEKEITNIGQVFRDEVIDKYNKSVSPYKRIMKFSITKEELPKTRLGKIRRFMLASLIEEKTKKKSTSQQPDFEEYVIIKDFLEKHTEKNIDPEDHLEFDIALDSLDKVSFMEFLNSTFGVQLEEKKLMAYETILKLSEYIKTSKVKQKVEAINWSGILKQTKDLHLPKTWFTNNLIKNTSKIIFKSYFRLKGEGTNNIPEGPVILAPNHQSYFDGLFVAVFLKNKLMKKTYFYAKEKHIRKRWVKFIADRNNVIIMDINRDLKASIQKMASLLKEKRNIIIFPEGTRSQDGNLGKFKKTFAILSRELNVPVVPISIKGAFDALPKGKKLPRPFKKIKVKFLEPVYPENHSYDSLTELVYNKIAKGLA